MPSSRKKQRSVNSINGNNDPIKADKLHTSLNHLSLEDKVDQQAIDAINNKILLSVMNRSNETLPLADFLSHFCSLVTSNCGWMAHAFDCLSLNQEKPSFRSSWSTSNSLKLSDLFLNTMNETNGQTLMDAIAVNVIHCGEAICIDNFAELATPTLLTLLEQNKVFQVVAFPLVANRQPVGILYFLLSKKDLTNNSIFDTIESALAQFGQQLEYNIQREMLERNYAQLRESVKDLRETQNQLIQSEKLISIGQLSAGIAHEVNNPMGFIKNNLDCLHRDAKSINKMFLKFQLLVNNLEKKDSTEVPRILHDISTYQLESGVIGALDDLENLINESMSGIQRVIDITRGLTNFSRKSSNELMPCKLSDCISEALKLARNEIKYKVLVHENHVSDTTVFANHGQLVQVILNIIINAVQSIDDKGELFISTEQEDNKTCLKIRDTGSGIPEDVVASIFNPFFTTKEVGNGTGLGLSIAYGIIASHNGYITVDSEVGTGTEIMIWLPTDQTP